MAKHSNLIFILSLFLLSNIHSISLRKKQQQQQEIKPVTLPLYEQQAYVEPIQEKIEQEPTEQEYFATVPEEESIEVTQQPRFQDQAVDEQMILPLTQQQYKTQPQAVFTQDQPIYEPQPEYIPQQTYQ